MPEKVIALDIGKVILDYNLEALFQSIAEVFTTTAERVREVWCDKKIQRDSDSGLSKEEIFRNFSKHLGVANQREFFDAFMYGARFSLLDGFIPFRDTLCTHNKKVIALSNVNAFHAHYFELHLTHILEPLIPREFHFFSCRIGALKGESSEHFHAIGEKIGIPPADIILIDDMPENIRGIQAAGGEGILFAGNYNEVLRILHERGHL